MRQKKTVKSYDGYGLAAPQLGVAKRIFIMEVTEEHMKMAPPSVVAKQSVQVVPLQVFVNPKMKITNTATASYREGCLSVNGV